MGIGPRRWPAGAPRCTAGARAALLFAVVAAGTLATVGHARQAVRTPLPGLVLDLGGGVTLDLVRIPAGSFTRGSPADEPGRGDDERQHGVTITEDFHIGRTAVTRAQWERFVAETGYRTEAETGTSGGWGWNGMALVQQPNFTWRTPGFAQDGTHPVCLVTAADAEAFCAWITRRSGLATSLPTEAQWEYTCRAGTTGAWHDGASTGPVATDPPVAWHKQNAGAGTHPVTSTRPNAWGLHVGGNVAEWCRDWYGPYPEPDATNPVRDRAEGSDKPRRVVRGGSWNRDPKNTRSAARFRLDPRSRNADVGFRVVCSATVEAPGDAGADAAPGAVPRPVPAAVNAVPGPADANAPDMATPGGPGTEATAPPIDMSPWNAPPPRPAPTGLGWFTLAWFAVPLVIMATALRRLFRAGAGRPPTASAERTGSPRSTPAGAATIDVGDDGFWFQGPWGVGTPLAVSYVVDGRSVTDRVAYRPVLAETRRPRRMGQFIFTGSRPAFVRVTPAADDPFATDTAPLDPGTDDIVRRSTMRDDRPARHAPPPRRPSAY